MRVLFVRHGESEASRRGVIGGPRGCTGLTARGRAQAEALRGRFSDDGLHVDTVLSSSLPRAHETAEILAPGLRSAGDLKVDPDLREGDPGEGDGLTVEEFAMRYGVLDAQAEPDRAPSPGGESMRDFRQRVRRTLDTFPQRYPGQTVVAVTHAGFIVWAFLTLFDIPRPGTGARIDLDFTSITEWEYEEGSHFWRLNSFNDTAHLRTVRS